MAESAIVKVGVYGDEAEDSRLVPANEDDKFLTSIGAIVPPYRPEDLCLMFDRSSSLRPNVEALSTNVEGFGHRLEPTIDLSATTADEQIRDSLLIEALYDGVLPDLSVEAVAVRRRELEGLERIERLRTELFLEHAAASSGISLTELRKRTRLDLEVTGNGYWEVLRNSFGEVSGLAYAPAVTMRLARADDDLTDVEELRRVSRCSIRRVPTRRRFRRFIEVVRGQEVAWFREYGDPRLTSSKTGKRYQSLEAMRRAEGAKVQAATEVLHFKVHSPISVYGVPRWVGAVLAILGTRESEEVNLTYFRNKAVPPLAILVSGGVLANGAAERIRDYIKEKIRGRDSFHSILVLEAETSGGAVTGMQGARVRVEIKSLMEAQQQDALFQTYEENNALKVGAAYRIPKILRGDAADVNRSTADAALSYTEQQVFRPERERVDYVFNRLLLDRGVRFLAFVSNGPVESDPPMVVEMVVKLVAACVITPNEGRALIADAFGGRFDDVEAPWARIPVEAAKAGFAPEQTAEELARDAAERLTRPDVKLAPTDAARVVTVNEARRSLSLGALMLPSGEPDPKGELSMAEFVALQEGKAGIDAGPAQPTLEQQARSLVQLRDTLKEAEVRAGEAALAEARAREAETVLTVPRAEFDAVVLSRGGVSVIWSMGLGGADQVTDEEFDLALDATRRLGPPTLTATCRACGRQQVVRYPGQSREEVELQAQLLCYQKTECCDAEVRIEVEP